MLQHMDSKVTLEKFSPLPKRPSMKGVRNPEHQIYNVFTLFNFFVTCLEKRLKFSETEKRNLRI